jgi:site-specific recombinase XerD
VKCYVPKARKFILSVFGRDLEHIHSLSALSLRELILEEAKTNRRGIASFISPLPTLLRFLYQKRILKDDLRFAVPRLAIWDLASAPAFLSNQEVERLLAACNRTTAIGRRDYAILCLLAEIGLRGGAIVSLNLEDIDWEERTIGVVQKGGEVAVLPLMDKSYHAIADYLSKDRVQSAERRLFLRTEAPIRGFSSTAAISTLVERALKKAGIYKSRMGSHIFRHSLATRMINGGASLTEIGAVLGHKSPNTTRIYAKVDIESLRSIARQWVGNTAIVHESIGRIR